MELTPKDIFIDYFINDPTDLEGYFNDAINLIHGEAQRKGHEFDEYFQTKWEDAADSITQFNEPYFENKNRRKLYVYLSAFIDDEIFGYLQDAYEVVEFEPLTKEQIKHEIDNLIKNGTTF